jgi:hypothetical protein
MTTSTIHPALATAGLDHHGTASHEVYTAGFYAGAGEWDFTVRTILGKSSRGGADVGEVLATVAAVQPGDRAGWFDGWVALGMRVAAIARRGPPRQRRARLPARRGLPRCRRQLGRRPRR